jgi:hypothetical protein
MTSSGDKTSLNPNEQEFVEWLARDYAPKPMTPAERVAFDGALENRLERSRRRWVPVSAMVAAAAAAAAVWLFFSASVETPAPGGEDLSVVVADASTGGVRLEELMWDYDSVYSSEEPDADESNALPEEYGAIASFFLDG